MGASRGRLIRQLMIESFLCALGGGLLGRCARFVAEQRADPDGRWTMPGFQGLTAKLDLSVFGIRGCRDAGLRTFLRDHSRLAGDAFLGHRRDQGSGFDFFGQRFARAVPQSAGRRTGGLHDAALGGSDAVHDARCGICATPIWASATENVISFSIAPVLNGYDIHRTIALVDQLRARFAALPGVRSVGTSEIPTLTGDRQGSNITVEGGVQLPEEQQDVDYVVGERRLSLHSGCAAAVRPRIHGSGQRAASPKVAVASESMAKRFFPGRNPIGMHFCFGGGSKVKPDIEIVGSRKGRKARSRQRLGSISPTSTFPMRRGPNFPA